MAWRESLLLNAQIVGEFHINTHYLINEYKYIKHVGLIELATLDLFIHGILMNKLYVICFGET